MLSFVYFESLYPLVSNIHIISVSRLVQVVMLCSLSLPVISCELILTLIFFFLLFLFVCLGGGGGGGGYRLVFRYMGCERTILSGYSRIYKAFVVVQKSVKLNSAGMCESTKKFIPNSLVDAFLLIRFIAELRARAEPHS